jgi:NADPH-dependent glutamate synthase beta subunit-like oxidoreductase
MAGRRVVIDAFGETPMDALAKVRELKDLI